MQKILVRNEKEFLALFKDWEFTEVEKFLDIEFPFADGTYHSDDAEDMDEDQPVDYKSGKHRKNEDACFPQHYPAVVLMIHDKDYDRHGTIEVQVLEFVYRKDFKR